MNDARSHNAQSLAELLRQSPEARRALEHNLSRQAEQRPRAPTARSAQERARCPHCRAEGVRYEIAGHEYWRWPVTCCPEALCLGAERELRNARNWSAPQPDRKDAAVRYLNLRGQIQDPGLLDRLDRLDTELGHRARAGLRAPLTHAQGGH